MSSMNIGFDAKRAFYNRAGLGNYSRNIIQYLQDSFPEHQYYLYSPKINQSIDFKGKDKARIILPTVSLDKLAPAYWRSFSMSKDIEKYQNDIFHGLSNEIPKGINREKTKVVVTIHDLIFLRFPKLYKALDRSIYNQKFKFACQNSDVIVAISEQTKQDIIHYYHTDPNKIKVVYQGCDPVYYQTVSSEKKAAIRQKYNLPENFTLNVGTIEKRKNILSIIKAMHQGKIDFPLVVVGRKTDYMDEIMEYIQNNHLENKIQFLHNVSFEDLPSLYQMSSLFVYPSIFEGFGIPVIEAINSRTPVITSNISSLPEAGGEHSFYVDPYNIEQISTAIKSVLNDTEKAKEMIEKSLLHVEKFRGKNVARELMKCYQ